MTKIKNAPCVSVRSLMCAIDVARGVAAKAQLEGLNGSYSAASGRLTGYFLTEVLAEKLLAP